MSLLQPEQRVGRYRVMGRLATGGMSEVYLAQQEGPGGFSKTVVMKVILPHLASDPQFVHMFHNEAKLAALLNHPNVVQIFDFGVEQGVHYMAMEYIDGRNLNHIARALSAASRRVPIAIGLRIVSDACAALDYAHSLRDASGVPLELIHRDVSLENVLVTYSGQVKLVDFGVAKARNLESFTQAGTLKGKYNYMAPEMILGQPIDHRADLFSLGVVLYHVLVGQLPFTGNNHAELLHKISSQPPTPPRQLAPDLSEDLERIVLGTLEKDPAKRYQRAGEVQAELERHLMSTNTAVMPYHLARFMEETFPSGSDEGRELYKELTAGGSPRAPGSVSRTGPGTPSIGSSASPHHSPPHHTVRGVGRGGLTQPPAYPDHGAKTGPRTPTSAGRSVYDTSTYPGASPAQALAYSPTEAKIPSGVTPSPGAYLPAPGEWSQAELQPPRRRAGLWVGLLLGLLIAGGVAVFISQQGQPVVVVGADLGAAQAVDAGVAGPVQRSDLAVARAADAAPTVAVAHDAGRPKDLAAAAADQALAAADLDQRPIRPLITRRRSYLTVIAPGPAIVYGNGKRLGSLPFRRRPLSPGSYKLEVRGRGAQPYTVERQVVLSRGAHLKESFVPRKGSLVVRVRPWAKVSLNGRVLGTTPIKPVEVYEGKHRLVLTNDGLNKRKELIVDIVAGARKVVKVQLQ